ncbi:probable pseudouridine-5'-phosphatase [Teleopsis dalmanni]|uniref:probable pseudouridine-5'-phosphatase n=1 Tax=Teleopsis dalmanni TaxID=139649 RepID=UPI0018CD73C4|nr:probable pseudouridine-5'-phosphatase [Teleopsis dalmanni]
MCECSTNKRRSKRIFRKVTHCIFELDGLLLDTEDKYEMIIKDMIKIFNKELTWEIRLQLFGKTDLEVAEFLIEEFELPVTVNEFLVQYYRIAMRKLRASELFPGAERLIRHLHKNRVPMALATSSTEDMVRIKTQGNRDVFRLLHHKVYGGSDRAVRERKPAPDIFFIASQRFIPWVTPMDCLVFEHSPNGVRGARTAKMQCVMKPDKRFPAEEMREIANEVLNSLEDFRPELYGLPAYPQQ